jgi:putative PEP-CTERM system TPR-repeat lipoprotein
MIDQAERAVAASDYPRARVVLLTLLQSDPDHARARFLLGKVLLQDRQPALAAIEFGKARALGLAADLVVPFEARALVEQGQWAALIDRFSSQTLQDGGAQADLRVALATAYASQAQMDRATTLLGQVLSAKPEHPAGRLLQARFKLVAGDAAGAEADVDRVLAAQPTSVDALQLKGDLWLPARPRDAIGLYRQAIAVDRRHVPSWTGLMVGLFTLDAVDELSTSIAEMRSALGDTPMVDFAGARLSLVKGDLPAAKEQIERVLRIGSDNAEVLALAGLIELRTRNLLQAEIYLTKAVGLLPRSQVIRTALASTYVAMEQPRRALEVLSAMDRRQGISPQTMAVWGNAYLLSGNYPKAEEMFRRALAATPGDIDLEAAAARVRIRRGDVEGGLQALDRMASEDTRMLPELTAVSERLRLRDFAGALSTIDRLERKAGAAPWVLNLRGRTLLQAGRVEDSAAVFERALASDPGNFEAAAGRAGILMAQGRTQEAKAVFTRILEVRPNDYRAHLAFADTTTKLGDPPEIIRGSIERALALNPGGRPPRISLIEFLLRQRDFAAAMVAAQSAVDQFANDSELLNLLGRAQLGTGNVQQAMVTFNRVVALAPESPLGYLGLADGRVALRDPGGAVASLRKALELAPGLETAQIGIVRLETAAGRLDSALAMTKLMQRERPQSGLGYLFEGDIAALRKDDAGAVAAYREGLRRQPLTELAAKLFLAMHRRGSSSEAAAFSRQWIAENPRDAAFHFVVADHALSAGEVVAAERHFAKVVELKPEDPVALNNLAWLMVQRGDTAATVHAAKAAQLLPDNPRVHETLAAALDLAGSSSAAAAAQRRAVELAPQNGDARLKLAQLLVQAGDNEAAKAELQQLARLGGRFTRQAEAQALLARLR